MTPSPDGPRSFVAYARLGTTFVGPRSLTSLVSAVGIILGLMAALAPSASAHNELLSSSPRDGAVMQRAPLSATLVFGEQLDATTVRAVLTRDGSQNAASTGPVANGNKLRVPMPPMMPPGSWSISYRVVSTDGHPVAGQVVFRIANKRSATEPVQPGATARPSSSTSIGDVRAGHTTSTSAANAGADEDNEVHVIMWVIAGILIAVAFALLISVVVHRRRVPSASSRE